jgi:hypothetical protein
MPTDFPDEIKIDEIQRPGQRNAGVGETLLEGTGHGETEVARFLARWLDNLLRIPGTDFKIGLWKTGSVCNSLTNKGAAMKNRARPAFTTPGLATWQWLVLQGRAIDS